MRTETIPKEINELSGKMKIVWLGQIVQKDPWKKITGQLKIGQKVNIEDMLKKRGFENESIGL